MAMRVSALSFGPVPGAGCARPAHTSKAGPARVFGSSAKTLPCRSIKRRRCAWRSSSRALATIDLPLGHFNGLNVPCAQKRFGNDFGLTYWGYQDSSGIIKYDSPSRVWDIPSQSSKSYYADVIGKMTGVPGNKGNVLRFYLFFDGRSAPFFDARLGKDSVTGLSAEENGPESLPTVLDTVQFKEDFFALCELAKSAGIKLIPVLWSFEALDTTAPGPGRTQHQGNHRYLFEAAAGSLSAGCCDAFVDVLKPFVSECESRFPGLVLAWDIFNEPEWGMASCPERSHTPNQGLWLDWVSNKGIQTFVAKCAVGIHEAGSMATLGSASMRYNWEKVDPSSTPPGSTAYWSDQAFHGLTRDDSKAYLDFYQIHYYVNLWQPWHDCYNPSQVAVTDFVSSRKAVLVGEIGALDIPVDDPQKIIGKGYYGVVFWAFDGGPFGNWNNIYQAATNSNSGFDKFPQ